MIREFIRSGTNVLVADIGTKAIGFGVISMLTFILDPESLGKYNALLTTVTSIYGMAGLGVAMVLQRESAKHTLQTNNRLGELVSTGFLSMGISIAVLVVCFQIYHEKLSVLLFNGIDPELILWVPVLTLLYFLVQSPLAIILGMGMFRTYSLRNMAEAMITGICVLGGAYLWHLDGIIYGLIASYTMNGLIVWVIMKRSFLNSNVKLALRNIGPSAARLLKLGVPYFIGNTFFGAVANIILIGLFSSHVGFAELGFLRLGLSLAAILMIVPNAAKTVTVTFIARHEMNATKIQSLQIRYLFFLVVISTLVATLLLSPVVSVLFGKEYEAGMGVYTMVLLISIFFSIQQTMNTFIAGRGDLMLSGIVNGILTLLYIGLSVVLIPMLGINGYYIAFGGSYLMGFLVLMIYDLRHSAYTDKNLIIQFLAGTLFMITIAIAYHVMFDRSWIGDLILWAFVLLYAVTCIKYIFRDDEKENFRKMFGRLNAGAE